MGTDAQVLDTDERKATQMPLEDPEAVRDSVS
jgi:hypothetical protein